MFDCYEIALFPRSVRRFIVPGHLVRGKKEGEPVELDRGLGDALKICGYARRLSHAQAFSLLRAAAEDHWSAHNIFRLVSRANGGTSEHRDLIEEAARLLAGGRYVLIEASEGRAVGGAGAVGTTREESSEPLVPSGDRTTVLRLRVVLDDGTPLAGAHVRLGAPDGQTEELDTGGSGEVELDDVAFDGVGRAVVLPAKVPRWRWAAGVSQSSESSFDFPFDAPVTADVATATANVIVLRRPEVERVDGARLGFAGGSPLLVPLTDELSPLPALATALARLCEDASLRLLIVGHASADGDARTNDALALRRAECARHVLLDDRDAWVELAATHGSPADVQKLLRYLAHVHDWPTEPARVDGVIDRGVETAVSAFQAAYNAIFGGRIMVDGVIGRETLAALFDVQRFELRHQLGALDVPDAQPRWFGASGVASGAARVLAHPGIPGSQTTAGQRRVDLLLIRDTLAWSESHGLERLYDVARFPVVPIAPLPFGPSDLVLQVVDHYGRILAGEPYRLTTDEDERVGTSDEQGRVIARGLHGRCARLECGDAVIVIDDPYYRAARRRCARVPPADFGDAEDDAWSEDPLPALDEDLDDEEES